MLKKFNIDLWMFIPTILLSFFGLFILYSVSGANMVVVKSQMIKFAIGILFMLIISQIPADKIKTVFSKPLYFINLLLIFLVFLVGSERMGAKRWLDFGFMSIQPSELMKLTLPMMLGYMIYKHGLPYKIKDIIKFSLLVMAPISLIIIQPDLGTSILVALSGLYLIYQAGINFKLILISSGLVISMFPILFSIIKDYQRQRILTLFNPESDPLGKGYHTIQSKTAIGNGGFSGQGFFEGTQTQLKFIPEQHTDFIFTGLAEEFGFLGYITLLILYTILIGRILIISYLSEDIYQKLVSGSIGMIFVSYIFVNIGMVSGILPVVGVPLPFLSYGGTFIITLLISLGLVCSFKNSQKPKKFNFIVE